MTLADILTAYRAWLGFPPAPVLRVPDRLAAPVYALGDLVSWLGWRPPIRTTSRRQLAHGVTADPAEWTTMTGIVPQSLGQALARDPAGVQDRWFARLYFVKPLAIAGLALDWLLSGLISLGPGFDASTALLRQAGAGALAGPAVAACAGLDIVLGLALLLRRTAKAALGGMLAANLAYFVPVTITLPRLWADPLGPLKSVPVLVLTLAVLAILDER